MKIYGNISVLKSWPNFNLSRCFTVCIIDIYAIARHRVFCIWVRSQNCACLVTWFCYQLIAKPGNKAATVPWPDPYSTFYNTFVYGTWLCVSGAIGHSKTCVGITLYAVGNEVYVSRAIQVPGTHKTTVTCRLQFVLWTQSTAYLK